MVYNTTSACRRLSYSRRPRQCRRLSLRILLAYQLLRSTDCLFDRNSRLSTPRAKTVSHANAVFKVERPQAVSTSLERRDCNTFRMVNHSPCYSCRVLKSHISACTTAINCPRVSSQSISLSLCTEQTHRVFESALLIFIQVRSRPAYMLTRSLVQPNRKRSVPALQS
jgi:hypothetical protein